MASLYQSLPLQLCDPHVHVSQITGSATQTHCHTLQAWNVAICVWHDIKL